jgi:hypothetical protein
MLFDAASARLRKENDAVSCIFGSGVAILAYSTVKGTLHKMELRANLGQLNPHCLESQTVFQKSKH